MTTFQLLQELTATPCIGHHLGVFDVAKRFLSDCATEIEQTNSFLKVQIGKKGGVVLEAHADQIGLIITELLPGGFVRVAPVGSIDPRWLPGTAVTLLGNEPVNGVFCSVPPHLSEGESTPTFDNCLIDTGREDLELLLSLGDYGVFVAPAKELTNQQITAPGLDNRSGVAAVLLAAKQLAAQGGSAVVLLTMNEELGLRGAKTAGFGLIANKALVVDVSFGNCPGVPSHQTARLGSGAMIGISPVLDADLSTKLQTVAKQNNIPFTLEVMGGNTSTNADVLSLCGSGLPCGLISIPLRNMHTPCEVVCCSDIEAVAQLLCKLVEGEVC